MGARQAIALAPPVTGLEPPKLRLHLIYTTPQATRTALRRAGQMANHLDATLQLLVAHVVPFPLPLDHPDTPANFTEQALASLVGGCSLTIDIEILLCRDRQETLALWLPAHAIVVIGRHRSWGPRSFSGLIRSLKRRRHQVIVVDSESKE
jgi:hypothetical protein